MSGDNQYSEQSVEQWLMNALSNVGKPGVLVLQIYKNCHHADPVKVCVDVTSEKACASFYLLGNDLYGACIGWTVDGSTITAYIESGTLNSGLWKLEKPRVKIEQHLDTGDGTVRFWAKLYELTIPDGYKKRREWDGDTILHW